MCLVAAVIALTISAGTAAAEPARYGLHPIAFLGDPAPGGGTFVNDFEPSAINDQGAGAFTADVSTGGEGVFTVKGGLIRQITRTGLPTPGGGTAGAGEMGRLGFNAGGDVAVPFLLSPLGDPFGINAGVYRYTAATGSLTAAAIPGTTMPGAGALEGLGYNVGMNDLGDIVFTGLADGTDITPGSPPGAHGIAGGVWESRPGGTLAKVEIPGDQAPGGGVFDDATNPSINDAGTIVFGGHVAGEPCTPLYVFLCTESEYLRRTSGNVVSIAHQGDPAPGGGTYRLAFGGQINSRDQVAFIGDLTKPPAVLLSCGVFLWSRGHTVPVALPGESMPGGGHLLSAGQQDSSFALNQAGDVSFVVSLDTDSNGHGIPDTGAYVWSHGVSTLIARTGTVIPGVGTVSFIGAATPTPATAQGGLNDHGQTLLAATLTNGRVVLLLASPTTGDSGTSRIARASRHHALRRARPA